MTRREFIGAVLVGGLAFALGAYGGITDGREPRSGNPDEQEPP